MSYTLNVFRNTETTPFLRRNYSDAKEVLAIVVSFVRMTEVSGFILDKRTGKRILSFGGGELLRADYGLPESMFPLMRK